MLLADAGLNQLASAADPVAEGIVKNGGMEEGDKTPAGWTQGAAVPGVQYTWDRRAGHKSKSSLHLHKTANRYFPIAQWHQILPNPGASMVKVRVWVKAEKAAKGTVDVVFLDNKGEWISHQWASYIGGKNAKDPPASHDWKEYSGEVAVPKGAKDIQIGLQIYGPGKLWFDDVRFEFVSLESPK